MNKDLFYGDVRARLAVLVSSLMLRNIAFSCAHIGKPPCWGGDGNFRRMPVTHSHIGGCSRYSEMPTSGGQTSKLGAVNGDRLKVPLVFRTLLETGGPSAVAKFVIARRVNAVNRMVERGSFAHVLKKCAKGFIPKRTDSYSPRAVFSKVFGFGVATSPLHAKPNAVCGGGLSRFVPVRFHRSPIQQITG